MYAGVPTIDLVCVSNGAGGSVWTGLKPMATLVLSGNLSGTSWLPARQSFKGLGAKRLEAPKSDTATWPEAWTSTCVEIKVVRRIRADATPAQCLAARPSQHGRVVAEK